MNSAEPLRKKIVKKINVEPRSMGKGYPTLSGRTIKKAFLRMCHPPFKYKVHCVMYI